ALGANGRIRVAADGRRIQDFVNGVWVAASLAGRECQLVDLGAGAVRPRRLINYLAVIGSEMGGITRDRSSFDVSGDRDGALIGEGGAGVLINVRIAVDPAGDVHVRPWLNFQVHI